jgi:hypothetical protein
MLTMGHAAHLNNYKCGRTVTSLESLSLPQGYRPRVWCYGNEICSRELKDADPMGLVCIS